MCRMSHVTCHICHLSHVISFILFLFFKMSELVSGGSVINGAQPRLIKGLKGSFEIGASSFVFYRGSPQKEGGLKNLEYAGLSWNMLE